MRTLKEIQSNPPQLSIVTSRFSTKGIPAHVLKHLEADAEQARINRCKIKITPYFIRPPMIVVGRHG